jgi:hypothetical protein
MIVFTPDKVAFGRHETFPLRYSWLTKGFQALIKDPKIFESDDATVTLGVGKNMVNAIRYWLQAAQVIGKNQAGFVATSVGLAIFDDDGYDPYLEDEATIWLIHWLLASNPAQATAWYWFFSRFHKPEFSGQELAAALYDFAKSELKGKLSPATIKNDAAILLRMYVRSKGNTRTPFEEALDSPLSTLGLITGVAGTKSYQSRPAQRDGLPIGILGFALAEIFEATKKSEIPIEELMYGRSDIPALGAVFRLTEAALLGKIERIIQVLPGIFEMRETAGIHQVYLIGNLRSLNFLKYHYVTQGRELAA